MSKLKDNFITLSYGSGGKLTSELIESLRKKFSNKILDELCDSAELNLKEERIAFTTDSFVVKPLFFPGGDIGKLAVCGTVNDLAMKGAVPLYLSLSLIIEEGLSFSVLERVIDSVSFWAKKAKVKIVCGDTKVVGKGEADELFINTAGVGVISSQDIRISSKAKPGDLIIINGPIAEHGLAVLSARQNLGFISKIKSDCKNLNLQVQKCLEVSKKISVLRDPTRGGLATALSEIAESSDLGIEVYEEAIPIKKEVKKMCDILGFDPLYIANEGKFICFVGKKDAYKVKKALGKEARIIGKVVSSHPKKVYLKTILGSARILLPLESEQLPRIC